MTIFELLIVLAIIGILAAIAVPQYAAYRQQAFNAAAESYIQFLMMTEEGYYGTNKTQNYTAAGPDIGPGPTGIVPGTTIPSGVGFVAGVYPIQGADPNTGFNIGANYTAFAGHRMGSRVYGVDSVTFKIRWRTYNLPNAAVDAESENATKAIPNGWGTLL